jgi:hypothetical protein
VKYVLFEPYPAGLNNVLISYEIATAISILTNRTLILPPKIFIYLHSEPFQRNTFVDFWSIFDKDNFKSQINCIDFLEVSEICNNYNELGGTTKYKYSNTKHAPNILQDLKNIKFFNDNLLNNSHQILINNISNQEDFNNFSQGRAILDLSKIDNKFIHFEQNLFGYYWYHIYSPSENERNNLKYRVNNVFKYKSYFYELAAKVLYKIGPYNAIHVRRNDFTSQMRNDILSINTPILLKNAAKNFFSNDLPLYISTDEEDKSFFDELKKEYKIFFYEDFNFNINNLERAIVEQIVCLNADKFHGTFPSTFSKRINIMRGLNNKQADDHIHLNTSFSNCDTSIANPWKQAPDTIWQWSDSCHPQWKYEENGFYKNFT